MTVASPSERQPLLPKHASPAPSLKAPSELSFTRQAALKRTAILVVALNNCLWAGSVLLYSLYGPVFQRTLGLTQLQVNAISVAAEVGMYAPVPIFGYICDRYGPQYLSLLSSAFFGPAYVLAALAFRSRAGVAPMMCAFAAVGMGTSAMYFAGVTTCAKTFTGKRGIALALPIASFGLSSLWQSQVVAHFFRHQGVLDVENVFWFFAASLTVVGVIGSVGLRLPEKAAEIGVDAAEVDSVDTEDRRWINEDTRVFLRDRTMWWFALGVFLVTGPGEAFINNMGALIQTLYPPAKASNIDPATHVSIIALTSTAARILAGSLSDYLAPTPPSDADTSSSSTPRRRPTLSRISLLLLFSVLMASGLLLVASGYVYEHASQFWYVSSTIGAGYGAVFTLAPTIVSVVWGTKNFGTNWGIVTTTPALGATLFGALWAHGYDSHAGEEGVCWGPACASASFAGMAAAVAVACLGWLWAWRGLGGWKGRGVAV